MYFRVRRDRTRDRRWRARIAPRLLGVIVAVAAGVTGDVSGQPAAPFTGVANVRDFRATGDGVTDDTAAVKQALAAALRAKGTIYFPPGTYLISDTLMVTDTVAFVGSGWGSVIALKDGVRRIMILVQGASPSGETIGFQASNIVFDGKQRRR